MLLALLVNRQSVLSSYLYLRTASVKVHFLLDTAPDTSPRTSLPDNLPGLLRYRTFASCKNWSGLQIMDFLTLFIVMLCNAEF